MKLSVILIIAVACAGWAAFILDDNHFNETHKFTQSCAENKGIAVRDLDNKMRCVPMLGRGK